MNKNVDLYFSEGCGRCPLGGTPDCKVHSWTEELKHLRRIVLECGLTETSKWGVPCYTTEENKNILIIGAFKESCTLAFFKGVLLQDSHGILSKPGEHSQSSRVIRFTNVAEIVERETLLKAYIHEAVAVEKAGLKVHFQRHTEPVPEEFLNILEENLALRTAFEALTPGRQRGYLMYFSAPKQSKTRTARIEKCMQKIFEGKGLNDDYMR